MTDDAFVQIRKSSIDDDLGPELGVFDRRGMLVASYQRKERVYYAWTYKPDRADIDRFLILDSEARARAFCLAVSERFGRAIDTTPPDLDEMWRGLSR